MREFAADRGYDLEDGEIESIIEEAEEDGDSVLDCADGRSESSSKTGLLTTRNKQSVGLERALRF